jgi:hypothetical protein
MENQKPRGGAVRTVRFPELRNLGLLEACHKTGKSPNWIVNQAVQRMIDSGFFDFERAAKP